MSKTSQVLGWLRAAGEPSRLRLLALCAARDLSVCDLAAVLGQSEPRVSRHLRILSESGLIDRVRNGQWVHYRLTKEPAAANFAQGVLTQLDRSDAQLRRDLDHALATGEPGAGDAADIARPKLGRALRDFLEANPPREKPQSALVVGVQHLELLESAAAAAGGCTAIAHSRRAAQSARAFAERQGFNCRVLLAATPSALSERDIDNAGQAFDLVILDHLAVSGPFSELLTYGRRALSTAGSLLLFERYESLDSPAANVRDKVVEHPLARLRRLLGGAGLHCDRLSPIEADGEHVLAAVAVPSAGNNTSTLRRA
jgi:DNA-binding transcriptional ArsR family regulator